LAVILLLKINVLFGCEFDVNYGKVFLIWQVLIKSENFLRITRKVTMRAGNANIENMTIVT
jgi:hypothetical protein